ncbi:hypothetical protein V8E36_008578 [Tilletia maclaganii]
MWQREGKRKQEALHDFHRSHVAAISMWDAFCIHRPSSHSFSADHSVVLGEAFAKADLLPPFPSIRSLPTQSVTTNSSQVHILIRSWRAGTRAASSQCHRAATAQDPRRTRALRGDELSACRVNTRTARCIPSLAQAITQLNPVNQHTRRQRPPTIPASARRPSNTLRTSLSLQAHLVSVSPDSSCLCHRGPACVQPPMPSSSSRMRVVSSTIQTRLSP